MKKHMPLPLKSTHPSYYADDAEHILSSDNEIVASYLKPENSAFILKACNSHYELLEACKFMVKYIRDNNPMDFPDEILDAEESIVKAEAQS